MVSQSGLNLHVGPGPGPHWEVREGSGRGSRMRCTNLGAARCLTGEQAWPVIKTQHTLVAFRLDSLFESYASPCAAASFNLHTGLMKTRKEHCVTSSSQ